MELFAIVGSVPAAFLASAIYSQALRFTLKHLPLGGLLTWTSLVVLGALVLEWVLLATLGAVAGRRLIGPTFYPVHMILFLLSIPALASILVIRKDGTVFGWWFVIGLLCGALALPLTLTQYGVSEALYGINRQTGPYESR